MANEVIYDGTRVVTNLGSKKTASGININITDSAEGDMPLGIKVNTEQNSYTGKNLVGYNGVLPYSNYGIEVTRTNETYSAIGTTSGYPFVKIFTIPAGTLNGTYLFKKILESGTSKCTIRIMDRTVSPALTIISTINDDTFTIENTHNNLDVEIAFSNNTQYNETFELLLQLSSVSDTSYEPYVRTEFQAQIQNIHKK